MSGPQAPFAAWSYDRIADLYDVDMARNMAFDDIGFYATAAAKARGPVLELGCGNGRILLELVARGIDAVGADRSLRMLEALRRKASARGLDVQVCKMDARRIAFADAAFDVVLCPYSLITYMAGEDDARRMLAEVSRILRADGCVILDAFVPRAAAYSDVFRTDYVRQYAGGTLTRSKRVRLLAPGINRIERRYVVDAGQGDVPASIETVEDIRPIAPDALRALAAAARLQCVSEHWDYGARASADDAQFFTVIARSAVRG